MVRSLLQVGTGTLMAAWLVTACDAGSAPLADRGDDAIDQATGALADATVVEETATDAGPDIDIMYPGYRCAENSECSTGLCYGRATKQGVFEPASCQTACLPPMDFNSYCNSDDDCCKGRCCLNCGSREGLCVLN